MIELIVSEECAACVAQEKEIKSAFSDDEFRIIRKGTREFESYEFASLLEFVPLIVIRESSGAVLYAAEGFHSALEIKEKLDSK